MREVFFFSLPFFYCSLPSVGKTPIQEPDTTSAKGKKGEGRGGEGWKLGVTSRFNANGSPSLLSFSQAMSS
ncbi:hypothetical protein B0T19DRAFT_412214 [Cercophora scortea]|uniref:Uncharacterized protein n=1 Tax=Cercophora scortea TaxID=314031 RepID=A0AAE0J5I6_9PEZI|nr:hypothetical protein B0T19DRAFT_412214 [Cercophora scortea]